MIVNMWKHPWWCLQDFCIHTADVCYHLACWLMHYIFTGVRILQILKLRMLKFHQRKKIYKIVTNNCSIFIALISKNILTVILTQRVHFLLNLTPEFWNIFSNFLIMLIQSTNLTYSRSSFSNIIVTNICDFGFNLIFD